MTNDYWIWPVAWALDFFFFPLYIYLFILFLAVLGLRRCAQALPCCGERGPPPAAVPRPLTAAASPVAEHRLQTRRLSSCGSRAQTLRVMRDPPGPGPEPVSPALAGGLPTTVPPGKPGPLIFTQRVQNILWILTEATVISLAIHFKMKISRSWIILLGKHLSGEMALKLSFWIECQERNCVPQFMQLLEKEACLAVLLTAKLHSLQNPFHRANRFLVPLLVRPSYAPSGGSYLESHQVGGVYVDGCKAGSVFFLLLLSCQRHLPVLTIDSPTSSLLSPLPPGEIIGLCDFH